MPISMFHERPTALNREQDSAVRLKPNGLDFSFAAEVNSVPLAGVEFVEAARSHPIFFLEPQSGETFPIALLGMASGGNRFVAADGAWRDSYVPAFVRRYPFVLAADDTVCFDEACPGFNRRIRALSDEAVGRIAHRLHGSAATYGHRHLADAAATLERDVEQEAGDRRLADGVAAVRAAFERAGKPGTLT